MRFQLRGIFWEVLNVGIDTCFVSAEVGWLAPMEDAGVAVVNFQVKISLFVLFGMLAVASVCSLF